MKSVLKLLLPQKWVLEVQVTASVACIFATFGGTLWYASHYPEAKWMLIVAFLVSAIVPFYVVGVGLSIFIVFDDNKAIWWDELWDRHYKRKESRAATQRESHLRSPTVITSTIPATSAPTPSTTEPDTERSAPMAAQNPPAAKKASAPAKKAAAKKTAAKKAVAAPADDTVDIAQLLANFEAAKAKEARTHTAYKKAIADRMAAQTALTEAGVTLKQPKKSGRKVLKGLSLSSLGRTARTTSEDDNRRSLADRLSGN